MTNPLSLHQPYSSPAGTDTKLRTNVAHLSCLFAFLIPVIVGLYWPLYSTLPEAATVLLRPAILALAGLLALLWYCAPVTSSEMQAASVLGLLSAALLIPSLTSTDPARAVAVWLKLLVLCAIALLLSRALRHQPTAKAFGAGLIFASLLVGVFTVLTYVRFTGFVLPTYRLTREFKGIAERTGIPLNAIPFTSVFSFLAGMCLVRTNWLLCCLGAALFLISSAFTGSRAPLVVLLFSALLLLVLNGLQSRRSVLRVATYLVSALVTATAVLLICQIPFKRMSSLTEGRWDLWYVAVKQFGDHPFLGSGYDSWHDDLVSLLPGAYSLTGQMAKTIIGGYHNEYLGLLADQGLVGFVPAMITVSFLLFCCWKSAFRGWNTWRNGQWALFACLFLLVRAGIEIPGLFGEGNEPADFLAYIFFGIMISRFSVEEDFLRTHTSSPWTVSTDGKSKPLGGARRPQGCHVPVGVNRSYL